MAFPIISTWSSVQTEIIDQFILRKRGGNRNENLTDGFIIRRQAIDHFIPLITNLQGAQVMLKSLIALYDQPLIVKSWQEFTEGKTHE